MKIQHFPEIKVGSYNASTYVYKGEVYHYTGLTFTSLEEAREEAQYHHIVEKGWRTSIILIISPDASYDFVRYSVYLNFEPKKPKTFAAVDVQDDKSPLYYPFTTSDRRTHIISMYNAGKRGIADMSTLSRRLMQLPPGKFRYELRHSDISPDYDIVGFDQPRGDVITSKTASGKTIRTGADTFPDRAGLAASAKRVLNTNFTKGEVQRMNLFFESDDFMLPGTAGCCSTHKGSGMPVNLISIGKEHVAEDVLTHEIVHALRAADGRDVLDRDRDEIETDYESKLRLQKPASSQSGYYRFIPSVKVNDIPLAHPQKIRDAINEDRILATGATDKPLKGRRLTHNIVPNTVKRSRIATAKPTLNEYHTKIYGAHQMIAEDVDNYFQIKLPDKSTVEYHIRFDEARPSLAKIKKHLKEKFGKNIEAWEWQDGKRVRLIGRSKKRTTPKKPTAKKKRTAKKATPRKTLTPPTFNKYPTGIPPVPGGLR